MESKRKRKRKTRAERNRLAHHLISSVDDSREKIHSKTITKETSASTAFNLRSGKTVPCTMEVKKINGASITQGRLTRRVGLFANMQSSDLISRGKDFNLQLRDINRDEKKKPKKIPYEVASGRTSTVNSIDDAGDYSSTKNKSPHNLSADEQDILLIGDPISCPSKDDISMSNCGNLNKSPSSSASPVFAPASIGSPESPNTEEFLDPVLPFQEMAERISKELKYKMARMFSSRNKIDDFITVLIGNTNPLDPYAIGFETIYIQIEMCSELQKRIKPRSQKIPNPTHFEDISEETFQHLKDTYEEKIRKPPGNVCGSPSSSYPGPFPPAVPRQPCAALQDGGEFLAQPVFQGSSLTHMAHNPCDSKQPQVSLHFGGHPFSGVPSSEASHPFIDRNNFLRRTGQSEVTQPKAMDIQIQKEEESDEESMNAFRLARYHSFVLSSRELNALHCLQHKDTVATEASQSVKSTMDSAAWKCNYPYCAWQSHNSHHHHHHHHHQSNFFRQDTDNILNLPCSSSLGKYSSYKHRLRPSDKHTPSHLDISRHRLKTALESASTRCQTRPSFNSRQDFSVAPKVSFPLGEDANFKQLLFQNDPSAHCSCTGPSLGQMKSHQTDLQFQARDFLDELENEFNQSHGRMSSERHSLLSDSVLYGDRQKEPAFTWKRSSTH